MNSPAQFSNVLRDTRGITLIELLVVMAIVAILGAASSPFLSRFILQANVDTTKQKTVSTIRKAQAYSMDQKNGAVWGICMHAGALRLYTGTCASPAIKEDFSIPSNVGYSGVSDITFSKRGEPSAPLTISISSVAESGSVQINEAGGLTIQ